MEEQGDTPVWEGCRGLANGQHNSWAGGGTEQHWDIFGPAFVVRVKLRPWNADSRCGGTAMCPVARLDSHLSDPIGQLARYMFGQLLVQRFIPEVPEDTSGAAEKGRQASICTSLGTAKKAKLISAAMSTHVQWPAAQCPSASGLVPEEGGAGSNTRSRVMARTGLWGAQ